MPAAANLSCPERAKCLASAACPDDSTLTRNRPEVRNAAWHCALFAGQTRTSGGLTERELNELAVKPQSTPARSVVVTTVTGLGTRAMARVNSAGATAGIGLGPPR